ncbi:MAG TPA: apolipoprotein N-acyltransferase, partial [Methylophilaceae bacterium]|nr:apolipoprotein N-acyltransferase [Methylophilaceae bacterium]
MRASTISFRTAICLAFGLGLVAVAGFAPFHLYPLPIAALAALFYLWRGSETPRQAAWLTFAFGLGLYGGGTYWIYISLHNFGGMPWWMAGFSTFALSAFLSLFPALVGWLAKRYCLASASVLSIICIPVLWALSDWIRSWIFTGFPWLTLGYSQTPFSPLAGFTPIVGVYGISLITALAASLIALWNDQHRRRTIVLGLAALWIAGSLLKHVEWTELSGAPVSVALLQGNIAQDIKWQPEVARQTLDKYLSLAMSTEARLIVMPETALPLLIDQVPPAYLDRLKQHAIDNHGDILVGAVEMQNGEYYNSVLSFGSATKQTYRKSHLVPFGEFIPLKGVFGWIYRDWLHIPLADLSRGSIHQQPLQVAGQQAAVNICYEDVFGEEIIRQLPQASLLVNVSNDAWYGDSLAADQHLQISQMRALETGRM